MNDNRKPFRITIAADDLHEFLGHCEAAAWVAADTGERVMTDEGPDAEAVILVAPRVRVREIARIAIAQ